MSYGLERLDHAVGNVPELIPQVEYMARAVGEPCRAQKGCKPMLSVWWLIYHDLGREHQQAVQHLQTQLGQRCCRSSCAHKLPPHKLLPAIHPHNLPLALPSRLPRVC